MKILNGMLAVALVRGALQAFAQGYPQRPVRVVIGFPPGSGTDVMGRVVISRVSECMGQTLLADNRGGAGGSIAGATAAKAAPDGRTLPINPSAHAVNPSFCAKLPCNITKDFTRALRGKPTVDQLTTLGNELNITPPPAFVRARADPGLREGRAGGGHQAAVSA